MILEALYQLHQIFTNIVNGILRQGQKRPPPPLLSCTDVKIT